MENGYTIRLQEPYQVGYAPKKDVLFVYWIVDDIIHCLGHYGMYQIAFIDDLDTDFFVPLGEL